MSLFKTKLNLFSYNRLVSMAPTVTVAAFSYLIWTSSLSVVLPFDIRSALPMNPTHVVDKRFGEYTHAFFEDFVG